MSLRELEKIYHWHVCGGVGSGAAGFNDAVPIVGPVTGEMICLGGVDVDAKACADFRSLTGVEQACLDLFTLDQYVAFHDRLPEPGWREATCEDIRRSAQYTFPNICFTSSPCKGFSGLLSSTKSLTAKYLALNELTLRGVWLTLEAFADNLPELFIFENVPRAMSRGRYLLDQIIALLRHYGYAVSETTHDCGEIGGLAQSRRRYLMVARLVAKVPAFLYQPQKRKLQAVGDVLGKMPLPGDALGGPMHRMPNLQWQTWVRLAFVEAGGDWRSLSKLAVEDGKLRDYLVVPCSQEGSGPYGVNRWDEPMGVVASRTGPTNGAYSIADPRPASVVPANEFRIVRRAETLKGQLKIQAEAAALGVGAIGLRDRIDLRQQGLMLDVPEQPGEQPMNIAMEEDAPRFTGLSDSRYVVDDPRPGMQRGHGDHYLSGGHYGVVPWKQHSHAVSASANHDNGFWSVADPRMPGRNEKLVAVIKSLDNTWHRPFTTLELAALQSIIDPEEWFAPGGPGDRGEVFKMEGDSDQRWREGIGNAVPRKAAKAIGTVMGQTILMSRMGETFTLSSQPVWVQPIAVALSVDNAGVR